MPDPEHSFDAALEDYLRLCLVSGVGPKLRQALLARFETAGGVLDAAPSDLREVPGVGATLATRIGRARDEIDAAAELEVCRGHGIRVIPFDAPEYPPALREIHDPPGVLFVQGELRPSDTVGVAIVGTRHATRYGLNQAERLAASLARAGLVVTSGLARGVDAAAHQGTLAAGGRTLAILGSGHLELYPPEHRELADAVARQGAVISEQPPRMPALAGAFPQRNRLISGLTLGVLVIEAAVRSGALITARHAMEQGREVFALPGPVDSRMSRGCHRLIRDGAKLVETADDVLEELGPLFAPASKAEGGELRHPGELLLNEIETATLAAIETRPCSIDEVIETSGLSAAQVLAAVSVLEVRRLVRRVSGQTVMRL